VFVRVRISVELGIQMQMWGPDFGGRVGAKLWFVTISFPFGAQREGAPPVDWAEFQAQLPSPISLQPEQGVQLEDYVKLDGQNVAARTGSDEHPILASSEGFSCATHAALSTSRITFNGELFADTGVPAQIRPMKLRRVDSVHHVTMTRNGVPYDPRAQAEPWELQSLRRDEPAAQWGEPIADPNRALTAPGSVPGRLGGLRFVIPAPVYGPALGAVGAAALEVEPVLPNGLTPLRDPAPAGPSAQVDSGSVTLIRHTILTSAPVRTECYRQLLAAGVVMTPDSDQNLSEYQRKIDAMFTSPPLITLDAR